MGMRRRVVRTPIDVRVRGADHVERLVLDFIHQPRGRRRARVRYPVPVVPLFVSASVVHHRVVLCREVVYLRLLVVVVVTDSFDDVGRVVG